MILISYELFIPLHIILFTPILDMLSNKNKKDNIYFITYSKYENNISKIAPLHETAGNG